MRSSDRLPLLAAFTLAAVHWFLAVTAVATKSATFDEPTHFEAGYSYWLKNDYRLDSEAGVLAPRLAALPLLFNGPPFLAGSYVWDDGALLLRGRMVMALFGTGICLLAFFWAREVFGARAALLSTTLACFSPCLLANSPLVATDTAAAFFFGLATWLFWRLLQKISIARTVYAGLALAGVLLSKMSGILILPVLALLLIVHFWRGRSRLSKARILPLCAALFGVFAIAILLIWAAYGFRYSAIVGQPLSHFWPRHYSPAIEELIFKARRHHLFPEAFLYGFAYVVEHAAIRPTFLDGSYSLNGFFDFFPRAFLYKTTIPFLLLLSLCAAAAIFSQGRRRIGSLYPLIPLAALLLVYVAASLLAHLNIGHRHLLPIYPPLFVMAGALGWYFARTRARWLGFTIAVLLCWHVGESLAVRPDYLAYFNELAGGPSHGYEHLVDSSLDWGQDLPSLAHWLTKNADSQVYLAYFGTAQPEKYGIHAIRLPGYYGIPSPALELDGGIYCISATTLQQVYARTMGTWSVPYERYYRTTEARLADVGQAKISMDDATLLQELRVSRLCVALRHRRPLTQIGHSILIYRLTADEVAAALHGLPAELLPYSLVGGCEEKTEQP